MTLESSPESMDRTYQLPRLHPSAYQADAVVSWTLTTFDRATPWLNERLHSEFRELMLHAAARENLLCPIYVLMPDHIHLIWMGLNKESDQRNGMRFLRTHLEPLLAPAKFQPQPHDHVLKNEERNRNGFAKKCHYIAMNPVRAKLVERPDQWKTIGCVISGYPRLNPMDEDFWPKFWRIYFKLRDDNCARHVVVPGVVS